MQLLPPSLNLSYKQLILSKQHKNPFKHFTAALEARLEIEIKPNLQFRTDQRTNFSIGTVRTGTGVYLGTVSDLPQK